MTQHCYLITGANSGIGLEATRQLVSHLAENETSDNDNSNDLRIYMLCRSKERAHSAMERIADGNAKRKAMLVFLKFDGGDDAETIQTEIVDKLPNDATVQGVILNAGGFGDGKETVKNKRKESALQICASNVAK